MNPFDFALQAEKDAETFYRRLAGESPSKGIAAIFTLLARAEAEHYDIVLRMKNAQAPQIGNTRILDEAKSVFLMLQDSAAAVFLDPNRAQPYVHQYRSAQELERQSATFYRDKAALATPAIAEAFRKLADEEDRHYWVLHNIIEHVGRPDFGWIEFAEWHHMETY